MQLTKLTPDRDLPVAAARYLSTPKDRVGPILGELFRGDAVVHDEGRLYVGLDAIRSWCEEVARAFRFTRMITGITLFDSAAIVQVKLEIARPISWVLSGAGPCEHGCSLTGGAQHGGT